MSESSLKRLCVGTLLGLTAATGALAMNLNLACEWGNPPRCSPPQTPILAFYNRVNDTMLFDADGKIEIYCQAGLRCSTGMTYSLHRNMVQTPFVDGKAEALPANLFKISVDTARLKPGFYDLRVKLDTGFAKVKLFWPKGNDETTEGVCVFGWKADQMPVRETRPADFRAFWDKAMADYMKIPLDAKVEGEVKTFKGKEIDDYNLKSACLPANYDPEGCKFDEVESFKISFAGPDGGRVYGWMAKPKGDGPFPAMLVLPGAGCGARPRPLEHARHGYLALDLQVHGQDVDQEKYEMLPGYNSDWVYEPIEKYYFRNLYLRAARAVDYLCSRQDVDKKRVVTVGGSQGGRLSVVVPALDRRVTATVPCIANSPNYPHLAWVAKCNGLGLPSDRPWTKGYVLGPKSDGMELAGAPEQPGTPEAKCMAYYDPMNFAPDVKCPAMFNAGMIDPISPPYSVWAAFIRLGSADKAIVPLAGLGHDWSAEFDRRAWRWLDGK